jgi:hypothetical protein
MLERLTRSFLCRVTLGNPPMSSSTRKRSAMFLCVTPHFITVKHCWPETLPEIFVPHHRTASTGICCAWSAQVAMLSTAMRNHSHAFPLVHKLRVDIPTAETRWVSITIIIIIEMTSTTSITTCSRWPPNPSLPHFCYGIPLPVK